jgi:alpha/beta hydrolase fold
MRNRPFHFPREASTIPPMSSHVQREADLALRAARGFVRFRVYWPPETEDGCPIAVFATDGDPPFEAAPELSAAGRCIVLALQTTAPAVVTIALEWCADHAQHLGADPGRLLVAGGRLAARTALLVRDNGWPVLARQVLIGPDGLGWPPAAATLGGVTPATVVKAPRYAARLRAAGVEVSELTLTSVGIA